MFWVAPKLFQALRFSGWTFPDGARTGLYAPAYICTTMQSATHTHRAQTVRLPRTPRPPTDCLCKCRENEGLCVCEREKDRQWGGGKRGREDTDSILMAAGWKQFWGEMNLIQIPPSATMCPDRPALPQHTSLGTDALCPLPSSPTSKLSNMFSCHSGLPVTFSSRLMCPCLCALEMWCLETESVCGSQSSHGREWQPMAPQEELSFTVPETVLSQQTSPWSLRM